LGNLGALGYYLGDYEASITHTRQAQPMFEEMGNRSGSARCLSNLGNSYSALGAFAEGLEFHERSHIVYQQLEDANSYADSYTNMGNAYHALGIGGYPELASSAHEVNEFLNNALRCHTEALSICKSIGSRTGEVLSHFNLGSLSLNRGDLRDAESHLQQTVDQAEAVGLEDLVMRSRSALARVSLRAEDIASAIDQSTRAIEQLAGEPSPYADEVHFTHFQVLKTLGDRGDAQRVLTQVTDSVRSQACTINDSDLRERFLAMVHEVLDASLG
jgi:tetratricopeptide (TPR) repeat protein